MPVTRYIGRQLLTEAVNSLGTIPSKPKIDTYVATRANAHSPTVASVSKERWSRLRNPSIGKSRGAVPLWSSAAVVLSGLLSMRTSIRTFAPHIKADLFRCRLHKFFGASTIYIVNRDDSEVEAVVKGFTDSPIPGFEPTIVHAKSAAQAQELEAVGEWDESQASKTSG